MLKSLQAIKAFYQAGMSMSEANKAVSGILSPKSGEIVLDGHFFDNTPEDVGSILAGLITSSSATKLSITNTGTGTFKPAKKVSFIGFDDKKQYGDVRNLGAMFEKLGQTNIKELSIANIRLGLHSYVALLKSLPESKIDRLHMSRTDAKQYIEASGLADAIGKSGIKALELPENDVTGMTAAALTKWMGKEAKVETIDLSNNRMDLSLKQELVFSEFFSLLPNATTNVSFKDSITLNKAGAISFGDSIHSAPQLTDLNLSGTGLSDEIAPDVFKGFIDSGLRRVDLSRNPLTEKGAEELAQTLEHPKCFVYNTHLDTSELPAELIERITKAEQQNKRNANVPAEQEKARLTYQDVSVERLKTTDHLFHAAKAGKIEDVLNKTSLSTKEYLHQDMDGKPLITHIAEAGQLDIVFTVNRWKNPKEMMDVWNTVPENFHYQMDGKDGRPNFQSIKSQVMANAVKATVSNKMNRGK